MKVKKLLISLILVAIAMAITFSSSVFAESDADITKFVELNLELMPGIDYGIDRVEGTERGWSVITKIGVMDGSSYKRLYNAYCADRNKGFENREQITSVPEKYIDEYNKRYDNNEIQNHLSNYKQILSLADIMYLDETDNTIDNVDYKNYIKPVINLFLINTLPDYTNSDVIFEFGYGMTKEEYLNKYVAGEPFDTERGTVTPVLITPEQIRAVQQVTLWHYTNGDTASMTGNSNSFLYYQTQINGDIISLADDGDVNHSNQNLQARLLFEYLKSEADRKADLNEFGVNDVYLYLDDTPGVDDEQPILLVKKAYKEFDLALRKFITSVKDKNGNNVSIDSREPVVIDSLGNVEDLTGTGLKDGEKTAKKSHTKEPLKVKKGYTVVYTIRVYNEGTVNGYAKEVTDYLPAGLTLKEFTPGDRSINDINGWTTVDGKTIITTKLASTELTAANRDWTKFDAAGKDVYYTDLQVECVVNSNAKSNNLRNIAEITDSEGVHGEKDVDSNINEEKGNVHTDDYNPIHPTDGRGEEDDDDFEDLTLNFDLALRKYITKIEDKNGKVIKSETDLIGRNPNRDNGIDESTIESTTGTTPTTATYKHKKDPVSVQTGYFVYYTLTVYNEGEVDGYATQIKDQLPEGLRFVDVVSGDFEQSGTVGNDNLLVLKRKSGLETQKSYEEGKLVKNSESVVIKCEVTGKVSNKILTNLAWISTYYNNDEGITISEDLDSHSTTPDEKPSKSELVTDEVGYINEIKNQNKELNNSSSYFEGQEDDDDFEKIVIENFDLALRKFITEIKTKASDYNEIHEYKLSEDRVPYVTGENVTYKDPITGETKTETTTAQKKHYKDRIKVAKGDKVLYTIRVYNEGYVPGYAAEVTDYLPDGLDFIKDSSVNSVWNYDEATRKITTNEFASVLLSPANGDWSKIKEAGQDVYYTDVTVECIVNDNATSDVNSLRNIAAITKYKDRDGNEITDIDSEDGQIDTENYNPKNPTEGIGEQDDDDLENLKLVEFDLALRKFITKVETQDDNGTTVKERVITDRVPQASIDETTGKIRYDHTKEPVNVLPQDIVTYTLRIFNEGNTAGYAEIITDDIPKGVEFLPDNQINIDYGWDMYKEITSEEAQTITDRVECLVKEGEKTRYFVQTLDPKEASIIRTDYLSKLNGELMMRNNSTLTENPNLLKAFDKQQPITDTETLKNPDYRDIKVAFRMIEDYGSEKIVTNFAQISDDKDEDGEPANDIDSETDKWNPGEDDQDIENIRVPNFDLALRKWVTQSILIDGDEEIVTNTGNQPFDDPEEPAKVELHRRKINDVVVKFRYSIRVYNDGYDKETGIAKPGFIAGYAKEVKDHIPDGLRFVQEDNPDWTVIDEKTIVTNKLANTLLQPGEYADVEVVLTWINDGDNLGIKVNDAEISKDDNEWGVPDYDSTPDNMYDKHEDDDDNAPVLLSVSTGEDKTVIIMSITIGFTALAILAGGIFLIKKYVL